MNCRSIVELWNLNTYHLVLTKTLRWAESVACICMLHAAWKLVRSIWWDILLMRCHMEALHGSLFAKCVDRRRELDSAGSCRIQRQIFAVIVIDHIGPSAYYVCIARFNINPYPTAFPYGNCMVLHFYQQQESSTTKTVHKVINKGLKAYV